MPLDKLGCLVLTISNIHQFSIGEVMFLFLMLFICDRFIIMDTVVVSCMDCFVF